MKPGSCGGQTGAYPLDPLSVTTSAERSKGKWRKTALISRLAEQTPRDFHSLHAKCSKLRRQFWRRLRRPRIAHRRLRWWTSRFPERRRHLCRTACVLSWSKDRKSQGKKCNYKDCNPSDCPGQESLADRNYLHLMAPCFGPLAAHFAPTRKLSHRGDMVGMGREPFDESNECPIGKIWVIALGLHRLPPANERSNCHAR